MTECFKNAIEEALYKICSVFDNPNYSRTKIKQKSRQLKQYIIPLLSNTVSTISSTAKTLAPIASVKYVHDGKETKRKRKVIKPTNTWMNQQYC